MKKVIVAAFIVAGLGVVGGTSAHADGNAFGKQGQACAASYGYESLGAGLQGAREAGTGNNAGGVRNALETYCP